MNEVQLTLLFLGLFVILIMLIHNWIQLKKHNKNENKANKSSKKSEITDENDPLFNPANPIFEREKSLDPKSEGSASEHLIRENLPNGIFREIETVASITSKKIQEGTYMELINHEYGIDYHAKKSKTICDEVLTSISERVQRVYI